MPTKKQRRASRRNFFSRLRGASSPEKAALAALKEQGVVVKTLSAEAMLLQVECHTQGALDDEQMEKLRPLAGQVAWLDLSGTGVGDEGLQVVARMENLTRLYLQNTPVTDAGLAHLRGLGQLEYLNLYGTSVTDRGLEHLTGLKQLRRLFLWKTQVSEEGARRLEQRLPLLEANRGEAL